MFKRLYITITLALLLSVGAKAQYDASFSHYWDMEPYFNPAAVGKQPKLNVVAAYALDMAGFENNPRTMYLGADMPFFLLGAYHGAGVSLINDQIGLFTHQRIALQYAYKHKLFGGNISVGAQFGFLNEQFDGSFDFYTRKTKDLIATVPAAAGTQFGKTVTTNVGNVDSHGIEVTLNATPIQTKDWEWNLSYNFTWQKMKVKNLSLVQTDQKTNMMVGPTVKDNNMIQVLTEGYAPNMFYVYHQLYDRSGKPIEGAYADTNKDGTINDADRYRYHSPMPDYIMGLSTSVRYRQLTLGMSFRANIGNYVYNATAMNTGAWELETWADGLQLNNLNRSYMKTGFQTRQYLSDYYVENASFLKLDNINLSYDFGKITKWCSLSLSTMVQNVFCITNYSGADPEVPNGVDSSFYPRPRTYTLSLGLKF